jgi:hypothetical protein
MGARFLGSDPHNSNRSAQMRNPLNHGSSPGRARAGRPLGATSWSRNLANVAAHHANVLLELWLAGAPVLEIRVLLLSLADKPEHQALIEECWRVRGGERRFTVPPKIKQNLCRLAVAYVTEMRRQAILQQCIQATERDLRRQGYSDGQIAEIMSRRVPERPHVEPPDIEKVLEIVNRRAPPGTLRRKAKNRVSHILPT